MNLFARKVRVFFDWYKYIFEKIQCFGVIFILTPGYYIILLTLVRQLLIQTYKPSLTRQIFDLVLSWFGFTNLAGNMMMSLLTDSKVKKAVFFNSYEEFCEKCNIYRPAQSWHCSECNACVLKRDHHCMIFSRCIGLLNQRYYILYLFYLPICLTYFTYHWYYYLVAKQQADESTYSVEYHFIIIPMMRVLSRSFEITVMDLEKMMLLINIGLIFWTLGMFLYHLRNFLYGQTCHEAHVMLPLRPLKSLFEWHYLKTRMVRVFGMRWYLAIVWPFVSSPLPSSILGMQKMY